MAIEKLLTQYIWLGFSNEQRIMMREIFSIPKSGGVQMMGGKLQSDGSNESDLKSVNIESMQKFTGRTSENFDDLLNYTIENIDQFLEEKKVKEIEDKNSFSAQQRTKQIDQVTDTILETIKNLPIDAQIKIKVALSTLIEDNSYETKTTKKIKKGTDEQTQ